MIKPIVVSLALLFAILLVSGCGDRRDLEDLTITLILGLDLDEHNNLVIYESSPVFDRTAQDKEEEFGFRATTFHEAQTKFDMTATALTVYGKTEVFLVGKKLMEHGEWMKVLDYFYRNSKMSVTGVVVAVDGPVAEIMRMKAADKPRLPSYLTKLLNTTNRRSHTVKTTLQELHRQTTDRGITPSISEIREGEEIDVTGTALLDRQGRYATALGFEEIPLLQILRKERRDISINLKIPAIGKAQLFFDPNQLTVAVYEPKVEVKSDYRNGRFRFDLNVYLTVRMLEKLFPYNVRQGTDELERLIEEALKARFQAFIAKIQKHKIDPIGLGSYARAFHYQEWKQVQEHWGETLAEADVNVTVNAKIKYMGAIK